MITQFAVPAAVPREQLIAGFREVAPQFQTPKGLLRKQFLISEDGTTAGGVYLWESRADAETFVDGVLRRMVREAFGVEANIQFFETPVIVDNVARTIT